MEREAVVDRSSTPDGSYIFENRAEIAFIIYYFDESGDSGAVVDYAARRCESTMNGSLTAGLSSLN